MSGMPMQSPVGQATPMQLFCPQCGKPMRVAQEHVHATVACPHCRHTLEPWRLASMQAGAPPTTPYGAPSPYPSPWSGQYQPYGAAGFSWRNRWIAGTLAILFGVFGVHRFYLGFTGIGLWMILVTVFTAGTVTAIWGLVEGILCFVGAMRDVDGLPLSG